MSVRYLAQVPGLVLLCLGPAWLLLWSGDGGGRGQTGGRGREAGDGEAWTAIGRVLERG